MRYKDIIACALMAIVAIGCTEKKTEVPLKYVETVKPEALVMSGKKSFSGVVKETQEISVGFKIPGQISKILVKEGDYVKEGQILAQIDTSDYHLGVEAAQLQYNQLSAEIERMKKVYETGAIGGNDMEKALSGLKQARVGLKDYQNKIEYATLRAPVSGYIQKAGFRPSEMVDAGTPVFTLLDVKNLEVETNIPAAVYMQQKEIRGWMCQSEFHPDDQYKLSLISINQKASSNMQYKVRLLLDGKARNKFTAGQNVNVIVTLGDGKKVEGGIYTVPAKTVFEYDERSYVWVVDGDSIVRKREIQTGTLNDDGRLIITNGLGEDDIVVKAGVHHLIDGEKVRVIKKSKTNVGDTL